MSRVASMDCDDEFLHAPEWQCSRCLALNMDNDDEEESTCRLCGFEEAYEPRIPNRDILQLQDADSSEADSDVQCHAKHDGQPDILNEDHSELLGVSHGDTADGLTISTLTAFTTTAMPSDASPGQDAAAPAQAVPPGAAQATQEATPARPAPERQAPERQAP